MAVIIERVKSRVDDISIAGGYLSRLDTDDLMFIDREQLAEAITSLIEVLARAHAAHNQRSS